MNNKLIKTSILVVMLISLGSIVCFNIFNNKNFLKCDKAIIKENYKNITLYCEQYQEYDILKNDEVILNRDYKNNQINELYDDILFNYINSYLFLDKYDDYEKFLTTHYDSFTNKTSYYSVRIGILSYKLNKQQLETVVKVLENINNAYPEETPEEIIMKIGNVSNRSIILDIYLNRSEEAKVLNDEYDMLWEKLKTLVEKNRQKK